MERYVIITEEGDHFNNVGVIEVRDGLVDTMTLKIAIEAHLSENVTIERVNRIPEPLMFEIEVKRKVCLAGILLKQKNELNK